MSGYVVGEKGPVELVSFFPWQVIAYAPLFCLWFSKEMPRLQDVLWFLRSPSHWESVLRVIFAALTRGPWPKRYSCLRSRFSRRLLPPVILFVAVSVARARM